MNVRETKESVIAVIALFLAAALPVLAETGSAESPDFTVNTVPEPAAMGAALVIGLGIRFRSRSLRVARRRRNNTGSVCSAGLAALGCLAVMQTGLAAQPVVTNVVAAQNGEVVDVYYDMADVGNATQTVSMAVSTNSGRLYNVDAMSFTGDIGYPILVGTNKHIVWDATADLPMCSSSTVKVRITADNAFGTNLYVVVDLSAGPTATNYPLTYLSSTPMLNASDKTTKILLRRIPAGTFVMGSPTNELGRYTDERQHTVTLSADYYLGMFEVTQGQYSNVMGSNPSYPNSYYLGASRPVEWAFWNDIRGGTWPGGTPGAGTFLDRLRTKTGLAFDLPTEAQWEYACRAGTTSALDNMALQTTEHDPYMDVLGRYWYDGGSNNWSQGGGHTTVGSYLPNNWGLYDTHGNVWEWCLDWYTDTYSGVVLDPTGPATGLRRVARGGSFNDSANWCRSAERGYGWPDLEYLIVGFRLALPASP